MITAPSEIFILPWGLPFRELILRSLGLYLRWAEEHILGGSFVLLTSKDFEMEF